MWKDPEFVFNPTASPHHHHHPTNIAMTITITPSAITLQTRHHASNDTHHFNQFHDGSQHQSHHLPLLVTLLYHTQYHNTEVMERSSMNVRYDSIISQKRASSMRYSYLTCCNTFSYLEDFTLMYQKITYLIYDSISVLQYMSPLIMSNVIN